MQRLLLIGEDETLLKTRTAIFRHAGFDVEVCPVTHRPNSTFFCLERYFGPSKIGPGNQSGMDGKSSFDAVILCHSLDRSRISAISAEARREAPATKIVVLEAASGPCVPPSACDASVLALLGPSALLRVVCSLLDS